MRGKTVRWLGLAAALLAAGRAGGARADDSILYDQIKEKFPEQALLFETLEMALEFENSGWAKNPGPLCARNANVRFAGAPFGPYSICATRKFGDQRKVRVIFLVEVQFLDANGWNAENRFLPVRREAVEARERFLGVLVEAWRDDDEVRAWPDHDEVRRQWQLPGA